MLQFLISLEEYQLVQEDFTATDPRSGRSLMGNYVAGFFLYWWHDTADNDVKVVKIQSVTG